MKLLMCLKCGDIFSLTPKKEKVCGCGETKGKYINNLDAEYSGHSQPLGFDNRSFSKALKLQRLEDEIGIPHKGVAFEAFFIPAKAKSVKKIKNEQK